MNRQLSIYLDLLRFIAAGLVFVSHVPGFAGGWGWQLADYGHEAVIFFFILSGFVIAYVVMDRKEQIRDYGINRAARIYSVALPALILTMVTYYLGTSLNPEAYLKLDGRIGDPLWTSFASLIFVNQSWSATTVFSNLPYWSLGYEVQYYLFFGILIFARGSLRWLLLPASLLLMGPSVMLYLPIWLLGVLCFMACRHQQQAKGFTPLLAALLYSISIIGMLMLSSESFQDSINAATHSVLGDGFYHWLLEPADQFAADYLLALFVALHVVASANLGRLEKLPLVSAKSREIRWLAGYTFSLYLYHMPLLFFAAALFPYEQSPALSLIASWIMVPLIIKLLGDITEKRKEFFQRAFQRVVPDYKKGMAN